MAEKEIQRVFTIQSHVVHGYVGNKSATFPLQLLGFEVDAINSVQFSNHTGYEKFAGQVLTDKDLQVLFEPLKSNNLLDYSHLLTGYVGDEKFLRQVVELIEHLKSRNDALIYVCDPVMGDNGRMYVPKELLPVYKEHVVPLADILTPNQFEAELLTGRKIACLNDAIATIETLHETYGCKTIVLTSTELGDARHLLALASTRPINGGKRQKVSIEIPRLAATFTGSGDLFASLLLAWMYKTNGDVKESLEKTIATMQVILKRTLTHAEGVGKTAKGLELKLIQSKRDIEEPMVTIKAKILE